METILEEITLEEKARELCEFVVAQERYQDAWKAVETFLADGQAKQAYRAWQEKGAELHRREHQGMEPTEADVEELERLKQAVLSHPVALNFVNAEGEMNRIFGAVTKLLQKTLQMGRVPTEEEMAPGDCDGSGGCGGCGCH